MAQPGITGYSDGGPSIWKPVRVNGTVGANQTAANATFVDGDFVMIIPGATGGATVYVDTGATNLVYGIAVGSLDLNVPLQGIVPTAGLDLTGQYVNGAFGPLGASVQRTISVLTPQDEVTMDIVGNAANANFREGDPFFLAGASGAWSAAAAAGGGAGQSTGTSAMGTITKIVTAATASANGVAVVTFYAAKLSGRGA